MSTTRSICSIIVIAVLLTISNFSPVFGYCWSCINFVWSPVGSDCSWDNTDNWISSWGEPPEFPPGPNDVVYIEPKPPRPCITSDAACGYLNIMPWSWAGAGDFGVDMYSGTFTVGSGISIGAWSYLYDSTFGIPDFTVYGGTVVVVQSIYPGDGILIGGGSDGFRPIEGRLYMYGGSIKTDRLELRNGEIHLFGGTLDCNSSTGFVFYQNQPINRIDISGGTLRLKGNHTAELSNYIASGRIVCLRGGALAAPVYDGTWTTLTGTNNFNVAWGPSPDMNATNIHYKQSDGNSITLSWQEGDLAKQHDVYFGTSTGALVYQGSRYDANSDPLNWTIADFNFKLNTNYYWRIDETNDSNVLTQGLVWKFKTHNGNAYDPKPINAAVALSEPLQLSWTAGDFAADTNGHKVYFATNANMLNAVLRKLLTTADSRYRGQQSGTSYSLARLAGSFTLIPGSTYYWCVDEVNGTSLWQSPVWSFTAAEYVTVDDFEDYNTTAEVQASWETVYATSCGETSQNGSVTLVQDAAGKHMLYHYSNLSGQESSFTEIKRPYNPGTSFTGGGVFYPALNALGINYIGSATNSADPEYDRMYVALQDTAGNIGIVLNPDAAASQVTGWRAWNVNLRDINSAGVPSAVKLENVNAFMLGFGVRCNFFPAGGDGNVMFDNIRLFTLPEFCWPGLMSADFDGNCYVDIDDLALMTQFWLMDCPPSNPCIGEKVIYCPPPNQCVLYSLQYPVVDLTGDDIMDFRDFSILGMEWKSIVLGP